MVGEVAGEFASKANSNLQLGRRLLGEGDTNAAANRIYYAMLQAAIHSFEVQRRTPESLKTGAKNWQHAIVTSNTFLVRDNENDRYLFQKLKTLREEADYLSTTVDATQLANRLQSVEQLIAEVTQ